MSQKIFLCIIGVLIVLFTGCGRQQGQMSYIGAESAKKTALKAALLTEKEISFIKIGRASCRERVCLYV